jgi:hypothetical protein
MNLWSFILLHACGVCLSILNFGWTPNSSAYLPTGFATTSHYTLTGTSCLSLRSLAFIRNDMRALNTSIASDALNAFHPAHSSREDDLLAHNKPDQSARLAQLHAAKHYPSGFIYATPTSVGKFTVSLGNVSAPTNQFNIVRATFN